MLNEAAIMIRSITKCFCVLSLLGGWLLMAQSLAPRSRTDNLSQMVDNQSTEMPAKGGLSQAVSAGVSATVQSELNVSVNDERMSTPDASRKKSVLVKNPCARLVTSPSLTTFAKDTGWRKKNQHLGHAYDAGGFLQHCRLQKREKNPVIETAEVARARRTLGSQLQAGRDTAGVRVPVAGAGMDSGSRDLSDDSRIYSRDFPDSTQGTALVSPPDMGTVSPLEWQPSADFGLNDFTSTQFLRPSLRAGRGRGKEGRRKRTNIAGQQRMPHSSLEGKPTVDSPETSLPSYETSVPSIDPSLLSPADQP